MADDFPRGWIAYNEAAAAVTASIVIPAVSGVAHVLDSMSIRLLNLSGAANPANAINVLIGATLIFQRTMITQAVIGAIDEITADLGLSAGLNQSLTVQFLVVTPAGSVESIAIKGHDL